jgi:energy-coupling factor transporter ATP-binding protein EcfA2
MKRRVLLARTLVSEPDLLLLDEPTNHLDIDAIGWLEDFLSRWPATFLFVTHDRAFLRNLATRILEIDRGRLFDWSCDYETFLVRKEAALAAEEKQNALFDKKLAQEEVWIRQGIKARRTRNEGRVRALKQLRVERSERREKVGNVRPLVGQSPLVVNLGVDYTTDATGTRARAVYNVSAPRIQAAGSNNLLDTYEQPRHLLDLAIAQRIGKNLDLKLTAANILQAPVRATFGPDNKEENIVVDIQPGTTFTLSATVSN